MVLQSRIITGNATLSDATDNVVILNDVNGNTNVISLPAGVDGLTYFILLASTNIGTWSLSPNGTDVLDASVIYAHGTITFKSGTWYSVV